MLQLTQLGPYRIGKPIGKGGMGPRTLEACAKHGCVYLHAIGGAAQVYAQCVTDVTGVDLKEKFGSPEAVWQLRVKDFPAVVTMDSRCTRKSPTLFSKLAPTIHSHSTAPRPNITNGWRYARYPARNHNGLARYSATTSFISAGSSIKSEQ